MMDSVRFADILMILVVCGVIFAILNLVNRSAKKKPQQQADPAALPEDEAGKK